MNKPTLPKYVNRSAYTVELEKYCEYLEKALDKACERLADNEEATTLFYEYHDKELWKEAFINE